MPVNEIICKFISIFSLILILIFNSYLFYFIFYPFIYSSEYEL